MNYLMGNDDDKNKIIQQALLLNTADRTRFVNKIKNPVLKQQVEYILDDETRLTQHLIQTSHGESVLQHISFNDHEPGTQINRITIKKLIGKGGMGSVYLGYDEKLKRLVAIKSIRPEYLQNEGTRQRFIREAQILSQINHVSICHIYDYIETPHEDFLVLEYIDGQRLNNVVFNHEQKIDAAIELASALSAAHELGVIHRDLKPDNIMVSQNGEVKILDFGIAQSTSVEQLKQPADEKTKSKEGSLTQQGALLGTIHFMSPEQANGAELDTSTDIYSLGIIFQELFTEQPAYDDIESKSLIAAVKQGKRNAIQGIDGALIHLINQMTAVTTRQRPSAMEVKAALINIKTKPSRRKALRTKLTVVVVLLGLLFWQWYNYQLQQSSLKAEQQYTDNIQQFSQDKIQIYQLPQHDISTEMKVINDRAKIISDKINQDENLTPEQRNKLQGQILFEAEQYEDAIPLLESGQASPVLLATAWKNLYLKKVSDYLYGINTTENIGNIKESYLAPALKYINQIETTNNTLYAFKVAQTESLEQALIMVNEIINQENWNNDAFMLKANILLELSVQAKSQGSWEVAHSFYLRTVDTFKQLIERARSYPEGYSKLCEAEYALASDALLRTGDNQEILIESGLQACEDIFKVQPDHLSGMIRLSDIYVLKAQMEINKGLDSAESLELAKKWNDQAIELSRNFQTVWSRASIHTIGAMAKNAQGLNPVNEFDFALSYYHEALDFDLQEARVISNLLFAYQAKTIYLASLDVNISDVVTDAKKIFDRGVKSSSLNTELKNALYVQMGAIYTLELNSQYLMDRPIQPFADNLIQFISTANAPIDTDPWIMTMLASAYALVAESLIDQNNDPQKSIKLATQAIDRAIVLNNNISYIVRTQAHIHCLQALAGNLDFSQTHDTFQKAYQINPKDVSTSYSWSRCLFKQAMASRSGKKALLEQALTHIDTAIDINTSFVALYKLKADIIESAIAAGAFDPSNQLLADQAKQKIISIKSQ